MPELYRLIVLLAAGIFLLPAASFGNADLVPTRYGLAGNLGLVYDPGNDIDFVQLSGLALIDYDAVWPHRAPDPLRFKLEAALGVTTAPNVRAIGSANMFALYFLDRLASKHFRPYAEAGIGIIYADFQVPGQGSRVNFNPQVGIGTEMEFERGGTWFATLRGHHVSNGHLFKDNRGINTVMLQLGRFFAN